MKAQAGSERVEAVPETVLQIFEVAPRSGRPRFERAGAASLASAGEAYPDRTANMPVHSAPCSRSTVMVYTKSHWKPCEAIVETAE